MEIKLMDFYRGYVMAGFQKLQKAKFKHGVEKRKQKVRFIRALLDADSQFQEFRAAVLQDCAVPEGLKDEAKRAAEIEAQKKINKEMEDYLKTTVVEVPDFKFKDEEVEGNIEEVFDGESLAGLSKIGVYNAEA